MDAYTGFAEVYDLFMDNIPYDEWAETILRLLGKYGITDGIAADLGCGTGQMTRRLAKAGFDMIGIDLSPEMLDTACMEGSPQDGILYLNQDLREMELYGTVRAFICICDTINYLPDEEDLTRVFRLVNNYLDPGGLFIFDVNTPAFYEEIGNSTIAENRDDASFIWENDYDPESAVNEYRMTFFIRDAEFPEKEMFHRFEELHTHRAYTPETIRECLSAAGLILLEEYDADTLEEPSDNTLRYLFAARENGKSDA